MRKRSLKWNWKLKLMLKNNYETKTSIVECSGFFQRLDLLFIEFMFHLLHVKQMYSHPIHLSHEFLLCIQLTRLIQTEILLVRAGAECQSPKVWVRILQKNMGLNFPRFNIVGELVCPKLSLNETMHIKIHFSFN